MKRIRILSAIVLAAILAGMVLCLCGCTHNQDSEFLTWMQADTNYQGRTLDKVFNEANSYAWYNLEVAAEEAQNYVDTTSKPKCDSFTVSEKYRPIKSEYHEYLSDVSLSYSYMKSAGQKMLYSQLSEGSTAIDNATASIRNATAHLTTLNELVKGL